MAATIFLACRRPGLTWIALGLLLATKQYMVLALPISFFLLPTGWRWRDWNTLVSLAITTALLVTLPLALWNWHAFWKSTVTVQQLAPFRWDAISYLVWYGFRGHLVTEPSTAVIWSSLAALAGLALSLWRSPRTVAGFAASLSLILLGFFSFNKQAFCNYYFFVIGAICCAIAATNRRAVPARAEPQLPPA
jgi:4-amino-4-deoxy-L-arabinose transferase-like glycosyltransferase